MSSSRSRRRCAVVAALASPAARCGAVRVAIGQDLWSIRNHTARFGAPDAVMSYASIGNLSGLWSPTDYGSGVEYADGAASDYLPTTHFGSGDVLLKQTVETLARIQQSEKLRREL